MSINSQDIRSAPKTPGVYLFLGGKKILYAGKAANIKKRLASYFRADAPDKARRLIAESTRVEWRETESEIEALIREAELIKKHRPKFNVMMRDDKSYFYVGISREEFPRIFITHQSAQIRNSNIEIRNKFKIQNSKPVSDFGFRASDFPRYIGPFTSGSALKTVLKLLRRIFPYCTCRAPHTRPCVNAQIGRCPGYCCLKNQESDMKHREEYEKNISGARAILTGKRKKLLRELKKNMREAVKKEAFEQAAALRDQAESIENIFRHKMTLEHTPRPYAHRQDLQKTFRLLFQTNQEIRRVEAYDISNISGTAATGSMAVFLEGRPAKSEYRMFNIKTVNHASDVDMIKEVIQRRLRHPEWQYPNLMVIDGGKPQLNAALSAVGSWELGVGSQKVRSPNSELRTKIYVAALAKREEELYFPNKKFPVRLSTLPARAAHFFQNIRDEAHRFARKQHHLLRSKIFNRPAA